MTLAGTIPGIGSHPELLTYRCDGCGNVETIEGKYDIETG